MSVRWALLLAPALSACATVPSSAPAPLRASGPADDGERRIMAAYPGIVRRVGPTLFIGDTELTDVSCDVDVDTCVWFRVRDALIGNSLFGVDVGYYERTEYAVAARGSSWITTGEKPVISPDGKHLAAAVANEGHETSTEGFHLWAVEGLELRRRIVREALSYTADLRWRGDECVSFTAIEGYFDGVPKPRSTWYVVVDPPEWRLTRIRDSRCR